MSFPSAVRPTVIPITRFAAWLDSQPSFRGCEIVGLTHSKNMKSKVLHEYLHIIIHSPHHGRWLRIIAERQTKQDQIIIGFWPWVDGPAYPRLSDSTQAFGNSFGSSGGGSDKAPLPLLMRYVAFRPATSFSEVTRILVEVHNQHKKYKLLSWNCFWYADAVFVLLANKATSETTWNWLIYRKHFLILSRIVRGCSFFHCIYGYKLILTSEETGDA
jgi:hypothetical protein